jgi:hypothetical protein
MLDSKSGLSKENGDGNRYPESEGWISGIIFPQIAKISAIFIPARGKRAELTQLSKDFVSLPHIPLTRLPLFLRSRSSDCQLADSQLPLPTANANLKNLEDSTIHLYLTVLA